MIFSRSCEYGIKATVYIAQQSLNDTRASLKDISKEIGSPEAFTAKILQLLSKEGIIDSVKGAAGGFEIDRKKMKKVKLIDIVHAIDGPGGEKTCVLGLKACSETHPCPVHNKYKYIKRDILSMLQNTDVFEMSTSIDEGLTCLKI